MLMFSVCFLSEKNIPLCNHKMTGSKCSYPFCDSFLSNNGNAFKSPEET